MAQESSHTNLLASIHDFKERDPFVPFDIVMSSGDRYRIEAPANLVPMRTELFYAYPGGERFVFLRINQISSVEVAHGGGRARRRKTA